MCNVLKIDLLLVERLDDSAILSARIRVLYKALATGVEDGHQILYLFSCIARQVSAEYEGKDAMTEEPRLFWFRDHDVSHSEGSCQRVIACGMGRELGWEVLSGEGCGRRWVLGGYKEQEHDATRKRAKGKQ